jgi:type II secretory pathway pseudopilin PulG
MVVLALLALVAGLVIPTTTHALGNAQLHWTVASVANLLRQGETRAAFEGRSFIVVFGSANQAERTISLVRDDGKVISQMSLPPYIKLKARFGDNDWREEVAPAYFFPNRTSGLAQLDLSNGQSSHVELGLEPLTGRVLVTRIYRGE